MSYKYHVMSVVMSIHVVSILGHLPCTEENRDMLERAGFFDLCGKEWLFPSIQDAVNHALLGAKLVGILHVQSVYVHVIA